MKIAICFHLGYIHKFLAFVRYLNNTIDAGYDTDLYITYQCSEQELEPVQRRYPRATFIASSRGCDTGAFLLQLLDIQTKNISYDYIFKIHTKGHYLWREQLLIPIADSPQQVQKVIQDFEDHPNVGLIGASHYFMQDQQHMQILNNLASQYKLNLNLKRSPLPNFVAGTIFWIRGRILHDFLLSSQIDLLEAYQQCELDYVNVYGQETYSHAWERFLCYLVTCSGFNLKGYPKIPLSEIIPIDFDPWVYSKINQYNRQAFCDTQIISQVTRVTYGITPDQARDITSILKSLNPDLTQNLNQYFGDPCPGQGKLLFIYQGINPYHSYTMGELDGYLYAKINFQWQDSQAILEVNANLEQGTIRKLEGFKFQNLPYSISPFDWKFYNSSQDLQLAGIQTYQQGLTHYLRYGRDEKRLVRKPGVNLLEKYKIKFIINSTTSQSQDFDNLIPSIRCYNSVPTINPESCFCISLISLQSTDDFDLIQFHKCLQQSNYLKIQTSVDLPGRPMVIYSENNQNYIFQTLQLDPNILWVSSTDAELWYQPILESYAIWGYRCKNTPRHYPWQIRGLTTGHPNIFRWTPEQAGILLQAKLDQIIADPNPNDQFNYVMITAPQLSHNDWSQIKDSLQFILKYYSE